MMNKNRDHYYLSQNPVNTEFDIITEAKSIYYKKPNITIYQNGSRICNSQVEFIDGKAHLDVTHLSRGIYLIKIENYPEIIKFVKD